MSAVDVDRTEVSVEIGKLRACAQAMRQSFDDGNESMGKWLMELLTDDLVLLKKRIDEGEMPGEDQS